MNQETVLNEFKSAIKDLRLIIDSVGSLTKVKNDSELIAIKDKNHQQAVKIQKIDKDLQTMQENIPVILQTINHQDALYYNSFAIRCEDEENHLVKGLQDVKELQERNNNKKLTLEEQYNSIMQLIAHKVPIGMLIGIKRHGDEIKFEAYNVERNCGKAFRYTILETTEHLLTDFGSQSRPKRVLSLNIKDKEFYANIPQELQDYYMETGSFATQAVKKAGSRFIT